MARLVVLRFDRDEDAEFFATDFLPGTYEQLTVEGMFQTPTKFHEGHQSSGWRKSPKHGWWICRDCGAPSVGWGENIRAVISSGNDLLEKVSKNTQERIDMVAENYDLETGKPME